MAFLTAPSLRLASGDSGRLSHNYALAGAEIIGRPYPVSAQGVIATLRRVSLMVSSRRGSVEVVR